jgi:hypothetical protein
LGLGKQEEGKKSKYLINIQASLGEKLSPEKNTPTLKGQCATGQRRESTPCEYGNVEEQKPNLKEEKGELKSTSEWNGSR